MVCAWRFSFLSLSLIIICVLTLVATGGRHKVNRTDVGQLEVELHAAGQIPNKMFPLFALLHSGKMFFVLFFVLLQFYSISKIEQTNQWNREEEEEEERNRVVFKGRQSINAPSPVDVIIDRLDVPCMCVRACVSARRVSWTRPRGSSGHSDERRARRRRSFRSVSRFVFLNFSLLCEADDPPLNVTV